MLTASDFRRGNLFEMDGGIYMVVDFQHVKPGKGSAFVRTKIKNILTGVSLERSFNTFDKFEEVHIDRKDMQFLYKEDDLWNFMDMESYEQIAIDKETMGESALQIIENMTCQVQFYKGKIIAVEPPMFVDLKVVDTEPAVPSEGAKTQYKPAKLETGLIVQVPIFINNEEVIRIDTRTNEYRERV